MKSFVAVLLGLCTAGLGIGAALAQTPTRIEEFTVLGTEPFWNVTISRSGIVYSSPDSGNRRYPYTAPMAAASRPADLVRVYRLNGQPNGMLVLKKVDACSDGMSDNVYPYDATLILGNRVLEGCARRK